MLNKELHYALFDSPVGKLGFVAHSKGLISIDYLDMLEEDFVKDLKNEYPHLSLVKDGEFISEPLSQIKEYFAGCRQHFTCQLDPQGTSFQKRVWQALVEIPFGTTVSYQDIARKTGDIKAVRAVGQANGRNPISIIIPCHRIIRKSGQLGGYDGGLEIKKYLLRLEEKVINEFRQSSEQVINIG